MALSPTLIQSPAWVAGAVEPDKLRRALDLLPAMVAYWDDDLVCRQANAAYMDWFRSEEHTSELQSH